MATTKKEIIKKQADMTARSIFDIEKYLDLMMKKRDSIRDIVHRYFYRNTGLEETSYINYIHELEELNYKIVMLDNEVKIQKMSTIVKIEDNEMSIEQAEMFADSLQSQIDFYKKLLGNFSVTDSLSTAAHFTYDELANKISEIDKKIYAMKKNIDELCISTLIELDVEEFKI